MSYARPPADTDIVAVSALRLPVIVGPDHWHRTRPQPAQLSVSLHLAPSYLNKPGLSDSVADSLHYGHLAKAAERRVSAKVEKEGGYVSARALVEDVTDAAFVFARDAVGESTDGHRDGVDPAAEVVRAVRIVLQLPKQILLAGGFEVELITPVSDWVSRLKDSGTELKSQATLVVRVTDLILPILIGVNPPERLAKQHVVTHITFFEAPYASTAGVPVLPEQDIQTDYPAIIQQVVANIESSNHLTLEMLVYEIIRTAYRAESGGNPARSRIQAITARCQKPSALSFADASEVEMTRTLETL